MDSVTDPGGQRRRDGRRCVYTLAWFVFVLGWLVPPLLVHRRDGALAVLLFDGAHPDAGLVDLEELAHELAEVNATVRHEVKGQLAPVPVCGHVLTQYAIVSTPPASRQSDAGMRHRDATPYHWYSASTTSIGSFFCRILL